MIGFFLSAKNQRFTASKNTNKILFSFNPLYFFLLKLEDDNSPTFNDDDDYEIQKQKRHIGAIARLGWTPSFRPYAISRFSRSGRTSDLERIVNF